MRVRVDGYRSDRRQLLLSFREVDAYPFDQAEESAPLWARHSVVVTRVVDYGVFVRKSVGVDGLLHKSNLPHGLTLLEGDVLGARVMSFDKQLGRVELRYDDDNS